MRFLVSFFPFFSFLCFLFLVSCFSGAAFRFVRIRIWIWVTNFLHDHKTTTNSFLSLLQQVFFPSKLSSHHE